MQNKQPSLSPRQQSYVEAYMSPDSDSFGNAYKSATKAGYTDQTARNMTHLQPTWLSENIGQMATMAISPEQIMTTLTTIINDDREPTIIKLKAMEMTMKAYNMLAQHRDSAPSTVTLNVNLNSD